MKRPLSISLRLAISGVLLFFVFREHDLAAVIAPRFRAMAEHWPWALAGVVCAFLSLLLTALRWQILLRGFAPGLPFSVVMRAEMVGAFFNISSLGVVGGDAYKIVSLSRRLPGKAVPVSVSLVLDHLTGLVAVSFLFAVCMAAKAADWPDFGPDARMLMAGYGIYVSGAVAGLLLCWIAFKPGVLAWGCRVFPRTLGHPRLAGHFRRVAQVHEVSTLLWRRMLSATAVSLVMYAAFFMSFYCGLRAVGGMAAVLDVLTAMPIVDTAASLPVSVSGLGVRERAFETLLAGIAGVPDAMGVSASLAGWMFNVFWGLVGGLLFLRSRAGSPAIENAPQKA